MYIYIILYIKSLFHFTSINNTTSQDYFDKYKLRFDSLVVFFYFIWPESITLFVTICIVGRSARSPYIYFK